MGRGKETGYDGHGISGNLYFKIMGNEIRSEALEGGRRGGGDPHPDTLQALKVAQFCLLLWKKIRFINRFEIHCCTAKLFSYEILSAHAFIPALISHCCISNYFLIKTKMQL